MNRVLQRSLVVAVNLLVLVVLLGCIELYYRIRHVEPIDDADRNGLWLKYRAHVTLMAAPGRYDHWLNTFKNETVPAGVATNSLGFNDAHEFDYSKPYNKAPGEKLVLVTGGSTAWGVGSSSREWTVAARMQHYLNTLQNEYKYTVINLAMINWIAFQEFIALELWGEVFRPDWIVVMDGLNDAWVGCGSSQGVGNPMFSAAIESYIDDYLFTTRRPVFYRGRLENEVIKYSAAYRAITGKQYVPNTQMFDQTSTDKNPSRRQIAPTKVGQARDMLAFYLKSVRAMLKLYPDAGYILSTQPIINEFSGDFADIYQFPAGSDAHRAAMTRRERELETYLTAHENEWCGQNSYPPSFTYVFVNGAIRLERLAEDVRAGNRKVEYYNMGTLFPNEPTQRVPNFIDSMHLADLGSDALGEFYAKRILAAGAAGR